MTDTELLNKLERAIKKSRENGLLLSHLLHSFRIEDSAALDEEDQVVSKSATLRAAIEEMEF